MVVEVEVLDFADVAVGGANGIFLELIQASQRVGGPCAQSTVVDHRIHWLTPGAQRLR